MNRNLKQNPLKRELVRERFRLADYRPQEPMRDATPIGDILPDILQSNCRKSGQVPRTLTEHWPLIAGEQVAQHTRPACLREGILYVYANHPGWLTELRRQPKSGLLKKIAAVPGSPPISDIRFQLDPEY